MTQQDSEATKQTDAKPSKLPICGKEKMAMCTAVKTTGTLFREGSFGKVYLCELENEMVAVKHIPAAEAGLIEIRRLKRCECNFVPKIYGSELNFQGAYIAMEFCPADLYDIARSCSLSIHDIAFYFSEIALGLFFIHSRNIIHGDIKPENICISLSGHIKIVDFGSSSQLESPLDRIVTASGTLPYADPQILRRAPHGVESDWWSFGVLVFELVFLCLPFGLDEVGDSPNADNEMCNRICSAPLHYPANCTKTAAGLEIFEYLARFLNRDIDKRISTFDDLMENIPSILKLDLTAAASKSLKPPILAELPSHLLLLRPSPSHD